MNILSATPSDAQGIAEVHVKAWQVAYRGLVATSFLDGLNVPGRAKRWEQIIREGACSLLVAKCGDQILGFVSFGKLRREAPEPNEGEIWAMYIDPEFWRTGVGRTLMAEALATLERAEMGKVWVWVLKGNDRAASFYSACGFVFQPKCSRPFKLADQELVEEGFVRDAA